LRKKQNVQLTPRTQQKNKIKYVLFFKEYELKNHTRRSAGTHLSLLFEDGLSGNALRQDRERE
jgi:hypothetical protein